MLILMLLMIIKKSKSETNWAYVPDPPALHPAVWEEKEIVVIVSFTHPLDQPATKEFLIGQEFSHVGYGKGIPSCVAKNIALKGCLEVLTKLIMGHD